MKNSQRTVKATHPIPAHSASSLLKCCILSSTSMTATLPSKKGSSDLMGLPTLRNLMICKKPPQQIMSTESKIQDRGLVCISLQKVSLRSMRKLITRKGTVTEVWGLQLKLMTSRKLWGLASFLVCGLHSRRAKQNTYQQ